MHALYQCIRGGDEEPAGGRPEHGAVVAGSDHDAPGARAHPSRACEQEGRQEGVDQLELTGAPRKLADGADRAATAPRPASAA
jgi:hypothetical protein